LTTKNSKTFANSQARFFQVRIDGGFQNRGDFLRRSPFYTRIQKLELSNIWLSIPGIQILEHTVSVEELVLVTYYSRKFNVGPNCKKAIEKMEKSGKVESWLPALRSLRIESDEKHV